MFCDVKVCNVIVEKVPKKSTNFAEKTQKIPTALCMVGRGIDAYLLANFTAVP